MRKYRSFCIAHKRKIVASSDIKTSDMEVDVNLHYDMIVIDFTLFDKKGKETYAKSHNCMLPTGSMRTPENVAKPLWYLLHGWMIEDIHVLNPHDNTVYQRNSRHAAQYLRSWHTNLEMDEIHRLDDVAFDTLMMAHKTAAYIVNVLLQTQSLWKPCHWWNRMLFFLEPQWNVTLDVNLGLDLYSFNKKMTTLFVDLQYNDNYIFTDEEADIFAHGEVFVGSYNYSKKYGSTLISDIYKDNVTLASTVY